MKKIVILLIMTSILIYIFTIPITEKDTRTASLATKILREPKSYELHHSFTESILKQQLKHKIEHLTLQQFDTPREWGLHVTGVKTQLSTEKKLVALTFDACGSTSGSQVDHKLINYLIDNNLPATLFINERWIKENQSTFYSLASNDLFDIQNHGTDHQPLSINGNSAYGIDGTNSVEEVIQEVMSNYQTIYQLTGKKPKYFRSGTAHYDEKAVSIVNKLGIEVVNFDINGDGGATYSAEQVKQSLLQVEPGSIALLHMNQPGSGTAEGVAMAVPILQEKGYTFVNLANQKLK